MVTVEAMENKFGEFDSYKIHSHVMCKSGVGRCLGGVKPRIAAELARYVIGRFCGERRERVYGRKHVESRSHLM